MVKTKTIIYKPGSKKYKEMTTSTTTTTTRMSDEELEKTNEFINRLRKKEKMSNSLGQYILLGSSFILIFLILLWIMQQL